MINPESSNISDEAAALAFGALEIFAPRAHKVATFLAPKALPFFSKYFSFSSPLSSKAIEPPTVEAHPIPSPVINVQINFISLKQPLRPQTQDFAFSPPATNQPITTAVDLPKAKESADTLSGRIDVGTLPVRAEDTRTLVKKYLTHLGGLLEQLHTISQLDSDLKKLIDSIQTSSFQESSSDDSESQIDQKCHAWNRMVEQMQDNIQEIENSTDGLYPKVSDLKAGLTLHPLGKEIVDFINLIEEQVFPSARAYLASYARDNAPIISGARSYLSILESIRKFEVTPSIQNLKETVSRMKTWTDTMKGIGSQPIPVWVSLIDYNLSKEWNCLVENSTLYISQQSDAMVAAQERIAIAIESLQKKTDVRSAAALLTEARILLAEHEVLIDTISELQNSQDFIETNQYFTQITSSTSSKELSAEVKTLRENAEILKKTAEQLQATITHVKEQNARIQKKVDTVWLGVKTFAITGLGLAIVGRFFGHRCFKY